MKNAEVAELKTLSTKLELYIFQRDELIRSYELVPSKIDTAYKMITGASSEQAFLPPGKYQVKLGISTPLPGYSSLNSTHYKLMVK